MAYHKITLYANELLPITERKKYVMKMYTNYSARYRNKKFRLGLIEKFNNALGYKDFEDQIQENGIVFPAKLPKEEGFVTPRDLLFEHMRTPVCTFDLLVFYLEDKQINYSDPKYTYHTKMLAEKWANFLKKVFPHLEVMHEIVDEIPKQSLREFAMEYFYRSLEFDLICTVEFRSGKMLTDEDIKYILPKIQPLSKEKIYIHQFKCETCAEYSDGAEPFHIEILYEKELACNEMETKELILI